MSHISQMSPTIDGQWWLSTVPLVKIRHFSRAIVRAPTTCPHLWLWGATNNVGSTSGKFQDRHRRWSSVCSPVLSCREVQLPGWGWGWGFHHQQPAAWSGPRLASRLLSWGDNSKGQLGVGHLQESHEPWGAKEKLISWKLLQRSVGNYFTGHRVSWAADSYQLEKMDLMVS